MYRPVYLQALLGTQKNKIYVFRVIAKHNLISYYCDKWKYESKLGKKLRI